MTTSENIGLEPLVIEFTVEAEADHAFRVWTEKVSTWWPPSHTLGGEDDTTIVFEPRAGGRIYERHADGSEHQWGWIVDWSPPERVLYKWHLFFDEREATDIEVTFTPITTGTRVEIRQTGWDRLGAAAETRRTRTKGAWIELSKAFQESLQTTDP